MILSASCNYLTLLSDDLLRKFELTDRSSSSRAKGRRTPKKKMKPRNEALLESNFREAESRENSDISDPEPTTTSLVQDVNTGKHLTFVKLIAVIFLVYA